MPGNGKSFESWYLAIISGEAGGTGDGPLEELAKLGNDKSSTEQTEIRKSREVRDNARKITILVALVSLRATRKTCPTLSSDTRIRIWSPLPDTVRPRPPALSRVRPHECVLDLIPSAESST